MSMVFMGPNHLTIQLSTHTGEKAQLLGTGAYQVDLLDRFNASLKENPHLVKKKVLLHQHNAPAHTSPVTTAKLVELHSKLYLHSPYSSDLASCYFFLFPNLKLSVVGKKYCSNEEVIAAAEEYFVGQKSYYTSPRTKYLLSLRQEATGGVDLVTTCGT